MEIEMDNDAKKTALRMIPYGIYVLTAQLALLKNGGRACRRLAAVGAGDGYLAPFNSLELISSSTVKYLNFRHVYS